MGRYQTLMLTEVRPVAFSYDELQYSPPPPATTSISVNLPHFPSSPCLGSKSSPENWTTEELLLKEFTRLCLQQQRQALEFEESLLGDLPSVALS